MSKYSKLMEGVDSKGGVEDTTFKCQGHKKKQAKAKEPTFQGQTILWLRTGMREAKTKDTTCKCYQRKKIFAQKSLFFHKISGEGKKVIPWPVFNNSKNSAVLDQEKGIFEDL